MPGQIETTPSPSTSNANIYRAPGSDTLYVFEVAALLADDHPTIDRSLVAPQKPGPEGAAAD